MPITLGNITALSAGFGSGPWTVAHNNNKTDVLIWIGYRDNANNTLSATYNGVSAVSIGSKITSAGSVLKVEMFRLFGAASGSNTLSISSSGSIGDLIGGGIISVDGLNTSALVNVSNTGGEAPGSSSPRTTSVTTTVDNCLIVDVISDRSAGLTVGAGQTQAGKVGSGDNVACSYKLATTAGSYSMSWTPTETIEDWAHIVFGITPVITGGYKQKMMSFF